MKQIIYFLVVFTVAFSGCDRSKEIPEKDKLARVYFDVLYKEDIQDYNNDIAEIKDSAAVQKRIIDNWVNRQLMFHEAQNVLADDQAEIDKLVEEYRKTLYIYKYEQKYLNENMDTNIALSDLEKYYEIFSKDFYLDFNVIKGTFIKVRKDLPDVYKVWSLYNSDKPENIKKLKTYCVENKDCIFDNYNNEWVNFDTVLTAFPSKIIDQENVLKFNKSLNQSDTAYLYFLNIYDYRLKNDTAPLVFIQDKLRKIILNKRKDQLLQELARDLYQNALNRKDIEIYN